MSTINKSFATVVGRVGALKGGSLPRRPQKISLEYYYTRHVLH